MRWEKAIYEVQYKVFDIGERVTPTSPRCPLDPGIYTVTEYHRPRHEGDEVVVFVEGHKTGVSGEYLTSVDTVEKPEDDTLVEKLQAYVAQLEKQTTTGWCTQDAVDILEHLKNILSTVV